MFDMGMKGRKWTLFTVSVDLFSVKGYDNVSVRDIAAAAGIKAGSIYNHFASKEEILQSIYDYYNYYYSYFIPPLNELLDYVGTEPPVHTLRRALFRFDPSIQDIMNKTFLIASMRLYCDERAEDMIFDNLYVLSKKYTATLLNCMLEKNIIEPLDIDSFILTLTSLCHSACLRMETKFPIEWDVWIRSVDMLYDMVKEK